MDYSRANKNQNLYKILNEDNESQISSHDLEKIANRLNKIDENNFDEMINNQTSNGAIHSRKPSYFNYLDKNEEKDSKDNKYLDDIINEVNQYNIRKGLKTLDSTSTEILKNIQKNDANLIYKYENDKIVNDELKNEIDNMFKESDDLTRLNELNKSEEENVKNELLEKTSNIQQKIEDYDTKINSVNLKLNNFSKTINVTLFILLIIFFIVVGVVLFAILKGRNII